MTDGCVAIHGDLYGLGAVVKSEGYALFSQVKITVTLKYFPLAVERKAHPGITDTRTW